MRRLGHRDVQTTLSRYGWVTEDAELRALADWTHLAVAARVEQDAPDGQDGPGRQEPS